MSSSEQFSKTLHEWIMVFMRRSAQDFRKFMDESGLSFSQVNTLMRLHFTGQVDISNIGAELGISNAAASQLVERLVRMELVERTEDHNDRRVKWLTLTPSGHALAEKLVDIRRAWMEKFTDSLSAKQRDTISDALQVLTEAAYNIQD